ncbi:MAG: site-specific integrase [Clostridia bacterium]|nr:site-specific integrase [Clostridia bacterium]
MNVTANLFIQHGLYYVILSYRDNCNKRKQKWIPTGITEKGNNKRLANQKLDEIKQNYKQYLPINCSFEKNESEKYFEVYIKEWLESYKNQIEENTYDSYKTVITKVFDFFNGKNIKLKELKAFHIQNFYDSLYKKGLKGNTILHYHANIRKALQAAVKLDIIPSNPADKIERPKKEQFIADRYNLEELQILFEKSKDDPLHLIILLASFYGLRRSEVLGLKWSAFDFVNNTITIKHKVIETMIDDKRTILLKDKTKNKSSYRSLPLIQEIKEALLEHKKQIEINKNLCGDSYILDYQDYIGVNEIGKIFRPEYITDHFSILLKNKNLRHIRFHDLRHSCASLLLARGIPMKAIQEWLGHSTYSTTANLYAHLESNTKNVSANVLSNALVVA